MSRRKREPKVVPMGDGWGAEFGFVVQWTEDPAEALRLAAAADEELRRDECGEYGPDDDPRVLAERSSLIADAPGHYRWNPCSLNSCWDGEAPHIGHLASVSAPGPGVWRGIEVRRPL